MEPAQPAAGVTLCELSELDDPGAKGFTFRKGEALFLGFVVRVGDEVYGYVDRCPHAFVPLGDGVGRYLTRAGDLILCGFHGALFRRGDGLCLAGPCAGRTLWTWPVRLEGTAVVTA